MATTRSKQLKRAMRRPFEWLGIFLAELLFSNVSHRMLFRLCDLMSAVFYRFDDRGRKQSLINLRVIEGKGPPIVPGLMQHAFNPKYLTYDPTSREEKIIRRSYRNMARTIGHIFWTSKNAAKRAGSIAELSPKCRAILEANPVAITVSAHMGCWEVLSQLVHLMGHPMISVAKDIGSKAMTKLLMKSRRSIGQEIVPAQGAFRPLMQALKDGKDIGLLVDQFVNKKDGGIWVWFLGRPMCVSVAPAFLSAKTHVPIIVAWSRPLKNGHYVCEHLATFEWEKGMDIRQRTIDVLRAIERTIRRHPSCWVLNYRYFNEGPTEEELSALKASL
ncbi:MAG: lysophospholipid acyltransferase family protein [Kiritimatiellae bacterium]|nr:lysophospholipid acyltransferase family protein [Kiritimatiellia bacterium]